MRLRRIAPLSVLALSALVLAGCAGGAPTASSTPSATPSSTADAACSFDAPAGATSDAVQVEGVGADATVTLAADLPFAALERTVLTEGDGEDLAAGDLVSVSYQIIDSTTGKAIETSVTNPAGDDGLVAMQLDAQTMSIFVAALECAPLGSQTVLAIPANLLGEGASPLVIVAQATEALPTTATGAEQDPTEGFPDVTFADDGRPTVTIPDAEAPTTTQIALLKKGDGPTVGVGDTVYVQYEGVKWSDGTVFDSSWERGMPTGFPTTGVVEGFGAALEGQQVGSQVIVVIPPAAGYGASEGHELQNETLVFVVDILAVQHVAGAAVTE